MMDVAARPPSSSYYSNAPSGLPPLAPSHHPYHPYQGPPPQKSVPGLVAKPKVRRPELHEVPDLTLYMIADCDAIDAELAARDYREWAKPKGALARSGAGSGAVEPRASDKTISDRSGASRRDHPSHPNPRNHRDTSHSRDAMNSRDTSYSSHPSQQQRPAPAQQPNGAHPQSQPPGSNTYPAYPPYVPNHAYASRPREPLSFAQPIPSSSNGVAGPGGRNSMSSNLPQSLPVTLPGPSASASALAPASASAVPVAPVSTWKPEETYGSMLQAPAAFVIPPPPSAPQSGPVQMTSFGFAGNMGPSATIFPASVAGALPVGPVVGAITSNFFLSPGAARSGMGNDAFFPGGGLGALGPQSASGTTNGVPGQLPVGAAGLGAGPGMLRQIDFREHILRQRAREFKNQPRFKAVKLDPEGPIDQVYLDVMACEYLQQRSEYVQQEVQRYEWVGATGDVVMAILGIRARRADNRTITDAVQEVTANHSDSIARHFDSRVGHYETDPVRDIWRSLLLALLGEVVVAIRSPDVDEAPSTLEERERARRAAETRGLHSGARAAKHGRVAPAVDMFGILGKLDSNNWFGKILSRFGLGSVLGGGGSAGADVLSTGTEDDFEPEEPRPRAGRAGRAQPRPPARNRNGQATIGYARGGSATRSRGRRRRVSSSEPFHYTGDMGQHDMGQHGLPAENECVHTTQGQSADSGTRPSYIPTPGNSVTEAAPSTSTSTSTSFSRPIAAPKNIVTSMPLPPDDP